MVVMAFAEDYAVPVEGKLGTNFPRNNDFKEVFYLRWGRVRFDVRSGASSSTSRSCFKVYRSDGVVRDILWWTPTRATHSGTSISV
jgi:hypothetical protein